MKKLILISQIPFGHQTDVYYYCKYLKDNYDIVNICWEQGLPKTEMSGIRVVYVSRKGNIPVRSVRFLRQALRQIGGHRPVIFISYFKGLSLALKLLRPRDLFVLDIRTGSVHENPIVRKFEDMRLKFEARFFAHVIVISQSLAEKLKIYPKAHILPQGADVLSSVERSFDKLNLLYVGTLFNRHIDVTIHGIRWFYEEFKERVPISYVIVGSGPNREEQYLKQLTSQYGLTEIVNVAGRIPHTQLVRWFDAANVGVSYVPLTDYYDCQPVTKTFEYLLSGMAVIATGTSENRKIIGAQNGVLIGDTAEDFYSGLKAIFERRNLFDSKKIRNSAMQHTWENIVGRNLNVYLDQIKNINQ